MYSNVNFSPVLLLIASLKLPTSFWEDSLIVSEDLRCFLFGIT